MQSEIDNSPRWMDPINHDREVGLICATSLAGNDRSYSNPGRSTSTQRLYNSKVERGSQAPVLRSMMRRRQETVTVGSMGENLLNASHLKPVTHFFRNTQVLNIQGRCRVQKAKSSQKHWSSICGLDLTLTMLGIRHQLVPRDKSERPGSNLKMRCKVLRHCRCALY